MINYVYGARSWEPQPSSDIKKQKHVSIGDERDETTSREEIDEKRVYFASPIGKQICAPHQIDKTNAVFT